MIGFIILAAVIYGIYRLIKWYRKVVVPHMIRIARKKREREIETAMLFGMHDAAATERVAERLINEYQQRD
ncbi:MAG TPA: hypothetical protein VGX23_29950 [Actinocrinis sp.]|nr:hypothetical protein [Actinocrinis sp.]